MAIREMYVKTDYIGSTENGSDTFPYKTLANWKTQELLNPQTIDAADVWIVRCEGTIADTAYVTILDTDLTVNGRIEFIGDNDTGIWSTAHYRRSTGSALPGITLRVKNYILRNFFVEISHNVTLPSALLIQPVGGFIILAGNGVFSAFEIAYGIRVIAGDTSLPVNMYLYNNHVLTCQRALSLDLNAFDSNFYIYNNSFIDPWQFGMYIRNNHVDSASCRYQVVNNICVGASTVDIAFSAASGLVTKLSFCNVTSDNSSVNGANYTGQTVVFRDPVNRDYRLAVADRGARRKGLGNSLDGKAPVIDAAGNARGDFPIDCGCHEVIDDDPTITDVYVNTDSGIGPGGDGSEGNPYHELVEWQKNPPGNIRTIGFNEVYHVWCSGARADTESVTLDFWSVTDIFGIRLHGDMTAGVWDATKYRVENFSRGGPAPLAPLVLRSGTENMFFDHFQVWNTATSDQNEEGIAAVIDQGGGYGGYYGCILKLEDRVADQTGPVVDMNTPLSDALRYVGNCLLLNGRSGLECINPVNSMSLIWSNNTAIGGNNASNGRGFYATGLQIAAYTNNLATGWTNSDYDIGIAAGEHASHNVSTDNTSPNAGELAADGLPFGGRTFTFKNVINEDYRLSAVPLDTGAIGIGIGHAVEGFVPLVDIQSLPRGSEVTTCGFALVAEEDFPKFNAFYPHTRVNNLL